MKSCFLILITFSYLTALSQGTLESADSLSHKDYRYFNSKYSLEIEDKALLETYTTAHLAKAKEERNYGEMVNAYKSRLHVSEKKLQLTYADSMILSASKSGNAKLLGGAYLTKGMVLYSLKRYVQALDYYLLANHQIENSGDPYLIHKVQYNIALLRYYMGDYRDAAVSIKRCIAYFEDKDEHAYFQSLHFLGLCYSGMGDFNLSVKTNQFAMDEEFRLRNMELHYCFLHSQGVNHYFLGAYSTSIHSLQQALPDLIRRHDFANESVAYFYIAKSHLAQDGIEKALPYLYKVDQVYDEHRYLRPDLREAYTLLIDYFRQKGDVARKTHYMEKLNGVDAMLYQNYKYLAGKIYNQYNIRLLLKDNAQARVALLDRNVLVILLVTVSAVFLMLVVHFWNKYRKTRALYLQNFNQLIEQRNQPPLRKATATSQELGINSVLVEGVLKRLHKFEEGRKYLDKDLTLARLSVLLHSNPNYVSKILYHYRSKKYLEYITDLRIDYAAGLLEREPLSRNYTYSALAKEAGFLTAKHFSKAFLKKTGLPLHFYIEELKSRAKTEVN
ncbi:hypothetical protein ACI6PS_07770 [Flavobacterium sp. PLA-1-15]|uniref:hypothetical protein n=1 Tax=Flavobacterium sp. PLA-1-15 TaxID=3380533 RepID=UPI003B7ECFA3